MWKIKRMLLEEICKAAKNHCPDEFMCFLYGENEKITEVVLLPNTSGRDYAQIDSHLLPQDKGIIGTIHSHPTGRANPSDVDKKFFSIYKINAIIDRTYIPENVNFFDSKSTPLICLLE